MLQIVQALDDSDGFFRCTEIRQSGPCAAAAHQYRAPCNIARVMHEADAAWRRVLAHTTLEDLRQAAHRDPVPGVSQATQSWLTDTGRAQRHMIGVQQMRKDTDLCFQRAGSGSGDGCRFRRSGGWR